MKQLLFLLLLATSFAQPVLFTHSVSNAIAGQNATIYITAAAGTPTENISEGDIIDIKLQAALTEGEVTATPLFDEFIYTSSFNKTYAITLPIPPTILLNLTCYTESNCTYKYKTPTEGQILLAYKRFDQPLYIEDYKAFLITAPNTTEDIAYYNIDSTPQQDSKITWVWAIPLLLGLTSIFLFYLRKLKWAILFLLSAIIIGVML